MTRSSCRRLRSGSHRSTHRRVAGRRVRAARQPAPVADSVVEARLGAIDLGSPLDVDAVARGDAVLGFDYTNLQYGLVTEIGSRHRGQARRAYVGAELPAASAWSTARAGPTRSRARLSGDYLRGAVDPHSAAVAYHDHHRRRDRTDLDLYRRSVRRACTSTRPRSVLRVESVQRLHRRSARHGGAAARGHDRVRRRTQACNVGEYHSASHHEGRFDLRVDDPTSSPTRTSRRGKFCGRYSIDTMDGVSFPREGSSASVEYRARGSRPSWRTTRLRPALDHGLRTPTWGRRTVLTTLRYDATIAAKRPIASSFASAVLRHVGPNRSRSRPARGARRGASYYDRLGDRALFPAFAGMSTRAGTRGSRARHLLARQRARAAPSGVCRRAVGPSTSATGAQKAAKSSILAASHVSSLGERHGLNRPGFSMVNDLGALDLKHVFHPNTNLAALHRGEPLVLVRQERARVDDHGKQLHRERWPGSGPRRSATATTSSRARPTTRSRGCPSRVSSRGRAASRDPAGGQARRPSAVRGVARVLRRFGLRTPTTRGSSSSGTTTTRWAAEEKDRCTPEGLSPARRWRPPGSRACRRSTSCSTCRCPHSGAGRCVLLSRRRGRRDEDDYATRLAGNLESLIQREGTDAVAALIAEPLMGVRRRAAAAARLLPEDPACSKSTTSC